MAQHFEQPTTDNQQPTAATCHCIQSTLTSSLIQRSQTEIRSLFGFIPLGHWTRHNNLQLVVNFGFWFCALLVATCNTRNTLPIKGQQADPSWQHTAHSTCNTSWHLKHLLLPPCGPKKQCQSSANSSWTQGIFWCSPAALILATNQKLWACNLLWCNDTVLKHLIMICQQNKNQNAPTEQKREGKLVKF